MQEIIVKLSWLTVLIILVFPCFAGNTRRKIYTVAGAYVGDGAPATSGAFASPQYAALDSEGNLYVADEFHCRLRKINKSGIISTYAGTGICGFGGDGGPAPKAEIYFPAGIATDSRGNVFFSDPIISRVRVIDASGNIHTVAGSGRYGFCGDGGRATDRKSTR